jgi:hypothetical protein
MPRLPIVLTFCLAFGSAPAAAQAPAGLPPELLGLALPPTVYVDHVSGEESLGRIVRVDADAIVLATAGVEHRIAMAEVRRVQVRGDSLRDGAVAGALVGLAAGLLSTGLWDCDGPCAGQKTVVLAYSSAVYAAIGTAFDAMHTGRRTVYRRPKGRPVVRAGVGRGPRGEAAALGAVGVDW